MGKKHHSDNTSGRSRGNNSAGRSGGGDNFRKFSDRSGSDRPSGSGYRPGGNDSGRGNDYPSRPAFGRPAPKSGPGAGFGGKRFGGGPDAPRSFGPNAGKGFGRDGGRDNRDARGGFGGGDDRRPFNRNSSERPFRPFDKDAPRRFDDRRGSGGNDRDRKEERPFRPYEPKANWPGQPYRQEGKPAVPRGGAGERNRKFNKKNPHEPNITSMPEAPRPQPEYRRDEQTGPDREIRPARPFDFRGAPASLNDEPRRGADRPERRDEGRDSRSAGPGRSSGERGGFTGRRDDDRRPARPGYEERSPRPDRDKRPAAPSNRADKPKYGEVPGESPEYKNLKHYEADKTRGNKRRREEEGSENEAIRLNRYIANAGICSRREADSLIAAGEIRVNGEVVTEMGYQVQPSDTVQYGKTNLKREKWVYVLLNKPKDFITTTDDPEGRKTVMDLVAGASKERIFPVGRLDRNTTGLLLFTNDGEVAQKLTHPSHRNKKIYQVELNKPLTEDHLREIQEGVELEDGKAEVDDVAVVAGNAHFVGIEIHIGRNRIVRRIFEHLGYEVVTLDRVQYAGLTKKDLPRGKWRFLSEQEVIRLKYFL
ncbi:pseudouridine synthase [Hymenobacter sp. BT175]|uniref:pseudouridine synthase n=1 Tax=Hymenobacter translucens TaxID=2886507 RepID=UPI001D0ED397|nr:pseudouridine synthase [Hymenobacter translucens]MCC2545757.1 pseudouridine synthase [Hymenobacter translucens]